MPENELISDISFVGKKILIAVSGGIAAYKSVELVRLLLKRGASVRVIMTESATRFVTQTSFAAISGKKVGVSLWSEDGTPEVSHLEFPHWADLVVLAPATANILAKIAQGIADDLVSTALLAAKCPILIAPAMNSSMWLNPATQENIKILKQRNFIQEGPASGEMAHPDEEAGIGRMSEPIEILRRIEKIFASNNDLAGKKVLITAGRTEEAIDSVRVLTNKSSGRMGCALAQAALDRGAEVVLVHGPMDVHPPEKSTNIKISSALDLLEAVKKNINNTDIVVYTAAVADYRPANPISGKHKREKGDFNSIELVENPDIAKETSKLSKGYKLGFALETDMNENYAINKMKNKGLDAVILNTIKAIGSNENEVRFVSGKDEITKTDTMSKSNLAQWILDKILLEISGGK